MEYRILGRTGLKISRLGFGGIPIQRIDAAGTRKLVLQMKEAGINFIDTARIYGDFARGIQGGSEQVIGRWMQDRRCREKIVLGTKGGHPDPKTMHTGRLDRESVLSDMQF